MRTLLDIPEIQNVITALNISRQQVLLASTVSHYTSATRSCVLEPLLSYQAKLDGSLVHIKIVAILQMR